MLKNQTQERLKISDLRFEFLELTNLVKQEAKRID
jgi:hypothetical protein